MFAETGFICNECKQEFTQTMEYIRHYETACPNCGSLNCSEEYEEYDDEWVDEMSGMERDDDGQY